jgi:FAD/FMN-containing dehydrogenase
MSATLVDAMIAIVGERHALSDRDLMAPYERDWTGRYGAEASMVVRPADTAEVAAVVQTAVAYDAAIIPQGGNTGLVGGGVPRGGEVVISLTRLKALGPVDPALGMVAVGAGVTLADLQRHAAVAGFDAAMDFPARDSCTIGGVVACDAGGTKALRHGTAATRTVGLEAVLADGRLVTRMAGLRKDNAGLSLPRLLIGSEGTLGVITRVAWKLEARARERATVLFGVASVAGAIEALRALQAHVPSLESCDFMTDAGFELVLRHQRRRSPLGRRWPLYLIAEAAGAGSPIEEFTDALDAARIDDVAVGDDSRSTAELWALREGLGDVTATLGVPHKMDVGVPLGYLEVFLDRLESTVADAVGDVTTLVWGHLGDGNLHVNVVGPPPEDHRADDAVLSLALDCGGTISAEHGVGTAKAHWLERARGAGEVAAMRAVKAALDPTWRLNPGAVFPARDNA